MTMITRSNIYPSMAAIFLVGALSFAAAEEKQVPFKGTFQGNDTVLTAPCPTTLCTSAIGTGTHLGQFLFTQEVTITNLTDTGSAQWKAANGDIIYTTVVGSAEESDNPDYLKVTGINIITGGTGRFRTHVTFGTFHGTITSPGARH